MKKAADAYSVKQREADAVESKRKSNYLYNIAGVPAIVANESRLDAIPQHQEPTKSIAHP